MLFSRDNKRTITLKNGKKIKRVIRTNKDCWHYVIYNGYRIGVAFYCGYWYEE